MARDGLDISGISNLATVALLGYVAFKGIEILEKPKVAGRPTTITGTILSDVGGGIVSDVGGGVFQFGVTSGNAAGSYVVDAAGNVINILGGVVGTVFTAGAYFGDAVGQQVLGVWNRLRGDTMPPDITLPVIPEPSPIGVPSSTCRPSGYWVGQEISAGATIQHIDGTLFKCAYAQRVNSVSDRLDVVFAGGVMKNLSATIPVDKVCNVW